MQRYYFPILHHGETQADEVGALFCSPDLAAQYGARITQDIASDPDCERDAGTVVVVVDETGAEIARHTVGAVEAWMAGRGKRRRRVLGT